MQVSKGVPAAIQVDSLCQDPGDCQGNKQNNKKTCLYTILS